jgi:DoxX-like protein
MQSNRESISRTRRITGNVLIYFIGGVLAATSLLKFAHVPKIATELGSLGFDGYKLTLVAVLEVISAVMLLIPAIRSGGLVMTSAYLGGAIATHIQHGQSPASPAFLLALAWIGVALRHPDVLWSLHHSGSTNSAREENAGAGRVPRMV